MDSWTGAQQLFTTWPDTVPESGSTGVLRRLSDALAGRGTGLAGPLDITSLTRQVLLEAMAGNNLTPLTVPDDPAIATVVDWATAGCTALPRNGKLHVRAEPWHPPAARNPDDPVAHVAAAEDLSQVYLGAGAQQRYEPVRPPADPFWSAGLKYPEYMSVGQRQAARAVALARPGSTLVICLPTGHGKTAVAQAPVMVLGSVRALALVVVPTVVLALDMERRARELLDQPTGRFAYVGDLADEDKAEIRAAVRDGRQRLLFTSPEALNTGLKDAVAANVDPTCEHRLPAFVGLLVPDGPLPAEIVGDFEVSLDGVEGGHGRVVVSTAAADFLVVAVESFRDTSVYDAAHVGHVDAEAERGGADHNVVVGLAGPPAPACDHVPPLVAVRPSSDAGDSQKSLVPQ